MVTVYPENGEWNVKGTFSLGYIGLFRDTQIKIKESAADIRLWTVFQELPADALRSEEQLAAALTSYINERETTISRYIKRINDNFLLNLYEDMEASGYPFWEEAPALVIPDKMPDVSGEEGYLAVYTDAVTDEMYRLRLAFTALPNDTDAEKPDIEAALRALLPMLNWDKLISGIEPEHLVIGEQRISFQCSDSFGAAIACGAYDVLDAHFDFTDWHNF